MCVCECVHLCVGGMHTLASHTNMDQFSGELRHRKVSHYRLVH